MGLVRVRVLDEVWNGQRLRNHCSFLPRRERSYSDPEIRVSEMVKAVAETVAPQLHGSLSQTANRQQAAKSNNIKDSAMAKEKSSLWSI